ncbi:MAG: rubrerythrin family protein, partial [Desulfovibrio sp.]|nr:rubrerythrin family protein [Desulfovibrio sp.]
HAKRLFKFLEGGAVEVTATFPAGVIGSTVENLKASASGENEEHTHMYPSFAETAEKEGFPEIADVMRNIAVAEAFHEKRFLKLCKEIEGDTMFKRDKETVWRCRNCGCLVRGKEAPELCPACAHPQSYFEELNYAF